MKKFYLYAYLDPRKQGQYTYENEISFLYEPIYIGKGVGDRCYSHLRDSLKNCISYNMIKSNKIDKIIKDGFIPIITFLDFSEDEHEILEKEKNYIHLIGRIINETGPLTNVKEDNSFSNQQKIIKLKKRKKRPKTKTNRIYSEADKISFSVPSDKINEYTEQGFLVIPEWTLDLKNNEKSRKGEQNGMFGKSAVKGRRWVITESGQKLFLNSDEISNLSEKYQYGRDVEKNKRKRIIIRGEIRSKYMSDEEIDSMEAGTDYQIGLVWKIDRKFHTVKTSKKQSSEE